MLFLGCISRAVRCVSNRVCFAQQRFHAVVDGSRRGFEQILNPGGLYGYFSGAYRQQTLAVPKVLTYSRKAAPVGNGFI